ncbi:Uncharacterized hydrolase YxeP [Raoultella terrigena]|uniref:Uncharacterized hydrolase YxeP n=1 Tax=Raoultella terrigena TaxID=577 RepID=A0A4U9CYD2_RAOTE|nr:Uncharacterized hydrolase YxeP [Raoultella terrigena]
MRALVSPAQLDWNFVFAAHLNGDKALLREVLTRWRTLSRRDAIIAVQAIVAEDRAAARDLAQQVEVWGVELENGQRVTVGSEAQGIAFARQAGSAPTRIARRESSLLAGTAEEVKAQLDELHAEWGIDEFIIDTPVAEGEARLQLAAPAGPGPSGCGGAAMSFAEQLIRWRRELHQYPELSPAGGGYHRAASRDWLQSGGLRLLPYELKTGLVVEVGSGEKLIALRADIDALPIEEATGLRVSLAKRRRDARLRPRHSHQRDAGGRAAAQRARSAAAGPGADPVPAGGREFWRAPKP